MNRRSLVVGVALMVFSVAAAEFLELSLYGFDWSAEREWSLEAASGNVVVMCGYAAFWLLLVPQTAIALAIAGAGIVAVGLVNAHKISELGEPLLLFDVFQIRNASFLLQYVPRRELALAVAFLAATAAALFVGMRAGGRRRSAVAAELALVGFAVLIGASLASSADSWAKRLFRTQDVFWDPLTKQRVNGFLVGSLLDVPQLRVQVPNEYHEGLERSLLDAFLPCKARDPAVVPGRHVVVTMLESFWDPTLEGLAFDQDPLPFYRQLRERAAMRHFVSPVFGGRTANAEFEVLTGLSMRFSPAGSIPYQQYLKRPMESVASLFRDAGYRTVAIHNFRRSFWNRDVVYPNLGFDEFVSLEDLGGVPWELGWPSDGAVFDRIEEILASTDRPTFVFAVTVATHGPYDGAGMIPTVQFVDPSRPDLLAPMSLYASKLALLDHHLQNFVAHMDLLEDPPIIVAFADHLPTLAARAMAPDSLEGVPRSRLVESFVLGGPEGLGDPGPRSLNCLGPEILQLGGIASTPFFRFVEDLCERLPIVTPSGAIEGNDDVLEAYRWLSYDRLFGAGYSSALCRTI